MPIFLFLCSNCKNKVKLFSHKDHICPKCRSNKVKRVKSIPLPNRNTEGTKSDYYGMESTVGISDDIKKRNKRHSKETLKETIDKFGKKVAKEQGWIDEYGNIKDEWEDK